MKITYFLKDVTAQGGMERVLANKCNYLVSAGHEVHIVSIKSIQGRQPFFHFNHAIHMWSLDCDAIYSKNFWKKLNKKNNKSVFLRAASVVLKAIDSDITISMYDEYSRHIHMVNDESVKVLELHFAKHKSAQYLYALERKPILCALLRLYKVRDYALIKRYARFVVLTEEDRRAWGDLSNMVVIPNAQTFPCGPRAALERKCIIAIGRHTKQKRFGLLVRAWSDIAASHPDGQLKIIGPGDKNELRVLAEKLGVSGSLVLQDAIGDVSNALLDSSLLVLSSRYEGFGMVLIEAMTCGVPVVSFDCKSGPSDIISNGEDGFLVPSGNTRLLSRRMDQLLSEAALRQRMGAAAYCNSQRFSEEAVMRRWLDLFEQIKPCRH